MIGSHQQPAQEEAYLFVENFDMDLVNLGESGSVVPLEESEYFEEGLRVLWKATLGYLGYSETSKATKLTVNQFDLDALRALTHSEFRSLATRRRSSDTSLPTQEGLNNAICANTHGPTQDQDGADLFFKVANHFYNSTTGREFRSLLGHSVRRYDFHKRAIPSNGGQYIPSNSEEMKFVESTLRCLMIVCQIDGMCGSFPIHIAHADIVKCQKQMRNRDRKLGQILGRNSGLAFCDVFFAALLVLVLRGYVIGQLKRATGGRKSVIIGSWHMKSLDDARTLKFSMLPEPAAQHTTATPSNTCPEQQSATLSLKTLAYLQHWTSSYQIPHLPKGVSMQSFVWKQLPVFLENPTACLEAMWFVYPCNGLRRHCTYCRYGDNRQPHL